MLIHDTQILKVSKVLCTCMLVERKHSSSVSVFELHGSKMSLLVNGASISQDGMGRTFNWLKNCAFTVVLFTQNHLSDTNIWVPGCSKFCVNRVKILISPVWIKCSVKFFSWLKIHQVPCESGLRHDMTHMTWPQTKLYHLNSLLKCLNILITESTVTHNIKVCWALHDYVERVDLCKG